MLARLRAPFYALIITGAGNKMRHLALTFWALFFLAACTSLPSFGPTAEDESEAPIVILVGLDGLRWDAIDLHRAPSLRALADGGVRAEGLIPAMPSLTFVNFYSIATGLYADRHGITSNEPYSRASGRIMERDAHDESVWWGGEPIWVTAEKQGVTTAAMFWLGSEAEIKGTRPTFWSPYDHFKPNEERVSQVLEWLAMPEETRPRFITLYFSDVDSAEHRYGSHAAEAADAIAEVDGRVGDLVAGIRQLGLEDRVNIIIVSDHGMAEFDSERLIYIDDYISLDDVLIPSFDSTRGPKGNPFLHIFVKDKSRIDEIFARLVNAHPQMTAYRRENLPERWHLTNADRTGDIYVQADTGGLIFARGLTSVYPSLPVGMHGYDRHDHDMYGTFIADGPAFRDGIGIEPFDNVNVYPIIAEILGLRPAAVDGDIENVREILRGPEE